MKKLKVLKFGGKSLANGNGLEQVISIIKKKVDADEQVLVVLSARDNTTDQLEQLLHQAQEGLDFSGALYDLRASQLESYPGVDILNEIEILEKTLKGVQLTNEYSMRIKDLVLAQGELMSVKVVSALLSEIGIKNSWVDSRKFIVTDSSFGFAHLLEELSCLETRRFFNEFPDGVVPVVTGFIGSDREGNTTTLGRNGSNYSASVLAKFLKATEVESYTHVNGIYTANPEEVEGAKIIDQLSYQEANEIASFGASILHSRSITPLAETKIPIRILNTFDPENQSTKINGRIENNGVKSIAVQRDMCIVNIEGNGLLGKTGIDGRIFATMAAENISVGVISQGSSERGVGFVIPRKQGEQAVKALRKEFFRELDDHNLQSISTIDHISVVTVVGQDLKNFNTALQSLNSNNIPVLLISNNVRGNNISLVLSNEYVEKTTNIIHSQIFGVAKNINVAIFGKGNVGSCLINQVLDHRDQIFARKGTNLNIFAVAGSTSVLLEKNGIHENWLQEINEKESTSIGVDEVIEYAQKHHLENLVAIDNTASAEFTDHYHRFIENGFDLISSNKIANTRSIRTYQALRQKLKQFNKEYLYETNVGAGLPLIDTIKLLHGSGENITRIRGVFSGSLSYIFNNYSVKEKPFSQILQEAIHQGLTEPDPREDLCGNDVARKLLILARELELENELEDVNVRNLIPPELRIGSAPSFLQQLQTLDKYFEELKRSQKPDHVLRYVGDLYGDLQQTKGQLKVDLVSVPRSSSLGQVSGSDSIFEIFTDSYGDHPIVIQGAGAGSAVTARGVFGDLLRIAE